MPENCQDNAFCRTLSETTRQRLCRACLHIHLKSKQEMVFKESSEQVAIIVEGVVISLFFTEDGKRKTSELLIPGDVYETEMNYMLALIDAKLCLCPVEVFKTFYLQCQDFTQSILNNMSSRFRRNLNHLMLLQSSSSEEKVRIVLKLLQDALVDSSSLTHEDLALLADLNRVTVTRAIRKIVYEK
jgi:CRP-like cAMP-binding protein